jgi:hypothetical protein
VGRPAMRMDVAILRVPVVVPVAHFSVRLLQGAPNCLPGPPPRSRAGLTFARNLAFPKGW